MCFVVFFNCGGTCVTGVQVQFDTDVKDLNRDLPVLV